MHKIAFVVLHYETIKDTKKCIDSLLKYLNGDHVHIVVVDNGSREGKLITIQDSYKRIEQVHFLLSDENLGFARGNNKGFYYSKFTLKADIITLSNNDIVFKQDDFVEKLEENYNVANFDVAGPRIISLVDSKNQNPIPLLYPDVQSINIRIIKYYILYLFSRFNMDILLQRLFAKEIGEFRPAKNENFQLHGACLIFANKYLEKYDGLYDKTFMYGEESILKFIVTQNKMRMCYFDDLCVFHKEGSSTGAIFGKGRLKRQFFYRGNIIGCKLLRKLMQQE